MEPFSSSPIDDMCFSTYAFLITHLLHSQSARDDNQQEGIQRESNYTVFQIHMVPGIDKATGEENREERNQRRPLSITHYAIIRIIKNHST